MKYRTFFIPKDSPIHRLNPLTKLTVLGFIIVSLYTINWIHFPILLFLLIIFPIAFLGRVSKEFFKIILKAGLPLILFVFVFQIVFYPGGEKVIWEFSVVK
ncbi:unnamed protein product [marine sediment metagenome]|uniref:Cobalt transport protein n=1 Tax=marine sediment metagenome TaxID=412755 RepID=X1F1A4_9ZZZZ